MNNQPSGSPYHTILPVDSQSGQSWNFIAQWKQFRSNSWSDSLDDCRIVPALDLNRFVFNQSDNLIFISIVSDNFYLHYFLIFFRFQFQHYFLIFFPFSLHHRSILGDSQRHLYDCYKRVYAEMLFRWNLLVPRAKVLKYLSVNTEFYRDVEYVTECTNCSRITKAPLCKECRKPLLSNLDKTIGILKIY